MFLGPRVGDRSTALLVVTGDRGDWSCLCPKHIRHPTVGLMTLEHPSLLHPCVLGQREKPQEMPPAPARRSLRTPAMPGQLCGNPACPRSIRGVTEGDTENTPGLHRYLWPPQRPATGVKGAGIGVPPGAGLRHSGSPQVGGPPHRVPSEGGSRDGAAWKVCKESTEHRLAGVSEGKFMHRL